MRYKRPNLFYYRLTQGVSWFVSTFIFKRKILRNEINGKKGPFVVIANHQAAFDFVNLIGITKRPMTFVVSNSFYHSLPVKEIIDKLGMIPKQQFQTSFEDIKKMKAVIENGEVLVLYPAGLMCEDGISTPIPTATYKFLKMLKADIYIAKTSGTYFAMPKWSSGMRPGKTYMDVYKLFSKEELTSLDLKTIQRRTDEAILFDAYREQETLKVKYKDNDNIEGLENVLYMCPHCKTEFSMKIKDKHTIYCNHCGYEETSDEYAFLHNHRGLGREMRYVSDWSKFIHEELKTKIEQGIEKTICAATKIHMIDYAKKRFVEVGHGTVSLCRDHFQLDGFINDNKVNLVIPTTNIPTLPFTPGKHLELQHGDQIYRCVLNDGKLVMKFINMIKIFFELNRISA
ncbi:MAG: 1-acyl-sn-glycerol-3-phosphate acyltransferase [Lachnospiraceae bacterium]|nr:1-acyl-sn-glycerol-3-phosphate acyltransferase [Lachnospiraceae bacterium]